jgi:hypothetical protein
MHSPLIVRPGQGVIEQSCLLGRLPQSCADTMRCWTSKNHAAVHNRRAQSWRLLLTLSSPGASRRRRWPVLTVRKRVAACLSVCWSVCCVRWLVLPNHPAKASVEALSLSGLAHGPRRCPGELKPVLWLVCARWAPLTTGCECLHLVAAGLVGE